MGEEEGPILIVRNWFECKREDSVLLKVNVENKSNGKIKFKVRFEHADDVPSNLKLPASAIKQVLFRNGDVKALVHFEKMLSYKPWTKIRVFVDSVSLEKPAA